MVQYEIWEGDLTKYPKITPATLEKRTRREYEILGYNVVRSDNKNHKPDWMVYGEVHGEPVFYVECKCYKTVKTVKGALNKWKRSQPKQYECFRGLVNKGTEIRIELVLHDNRIREITLFKDGEAPKQDKKGGKI